MLKKLFSSLREYKTPALLAPVFVLLESILEIAIPTIMAGLIDYGIMKSDMNYTMRTGVVLVLAAMLALFFGIMSSRFSATASAGFAKNLRHDMFEKVQTFSFSNIDRFSTASIITRMTSDVQRMQMALQMLLRMGIRAPSMLICSLVFAFRIDAKLSMIFLAVIPVLVIGLALIMSKVNPIFRRLFKAYDLLNNVVGENLHAIRVVKSYTREGHESEKFQQVSKNIFQDFSNAELRLAFAAPLMQLCVNISVLFLAWFGAKEIIASGNNPLLGLSTGGLSSLITYTMQILMSLMMSSMIFVMVIMSRASAERISELLQEEVDLTAKNHPVTMVENGDIRFENVMFRYGDKAEKPVLKNINLDIKSGQTVGILGGTGASKSSLVQLIARLYDVCEGAVYVGGVDVREYALDTLRDEVAMVLQKNVLFSGTIKENLRWGDANADDAQLVRACKLAQADEFIAGFPDGYDSHVEQGGANLSGGQRQRLCIARALLKKPKILILDDSTSAVDMKTDQRIQQALTSEIPDTTKIIIAQRVSSVQNADQILVMEGGTIYAMGTHEQLLAHCDIYQEVYNSQNQAGVIHE